MKKTTSIKTRITIWYTTLMFILIAIVLSIVGMASYGLSQDNIEKDIIAQVSLVSEKINPRHNEMFYTFDSNRNFKNVSIYKSDGEYITGQYIYDIANIPFKEGLPRKEVVDGKKYIIYDIFKPGPPGMHMGFWIRGAESLNSSVIFGRSAFVVILIVIPLILLLTALGGYYITKKAFLPVNNIIKTANTISTQSDIKQRITLNNDAKQDELYNLSVTLNTMLDKIEHLIVQEKQFTSDASHELRTPVSVILAQGEYLLDIAKTDKEKELAQNIIDKAQQMSKLVSGLLLLARIDQKRQKVNTEKVDIGVITDIAIDNLKEIADKKGIIFITEIQDNTIVFADESLLLSAVTNLINNAVKYSKQSGKIIVTASKDDDIVQITVADNGIGISKENLDKIWERFYRADDVRNDEYGSSGLGLAMVKSIVELHGGEIRVKSELGKGTEFTILLKNKRAASPMSRTYNV